jgi:hypothetical protein
MNWYKLYFYLRKWVLVGCGSAISGGWGIIVAIMLKVFFEMDEEVALLYIGLPLFLILFVWGISFMPNALRKAGLLPSEEEDLGPWIN